MPEEEPKTPAPDGNGQGEPTRNQWAQVVRYSQLAFALPGATVVGWLLGAALDAWLKTTWINRVGLFLGIIAGFVELIRGALNLSHEK
jgi:F0F1-type ATP synthase assembly protein I